MADITVSKSSLVERYRPGVLEHKLDGAVGHALTATERLRRQGRDVRLAGSVLVPADDTVFWLFGGDDSDVRTASEQAGVGFERILETVRIDSTQPGEADNDACYRRMSLVCRGRGRAHPDRRPVMPRLPVFLAGVASVVLLASCSTSPGSHGPSAGSSPPASASGPSPTLALAAPVGRAPTIRIVGNHFVDGHGDEIRLLGVNFAGVEGACVDPGFQQGATDQHPGAVFDYQGPNPVVVPGQPDQPAEAFFATLAAWHVNAVRFMVNEMCWLGQPPNPRNNPTVAPIPQSHYSAARYRQAIETFVASLHRYGSVQPHVRQ